MSRHTASSPRRPRSLGLLGALVLALALALALLSTSTAPYASAQQLGLINAGPSIGSTAFIQNGTIGSAPSQIRNGDFSYSLYFTNLYTDGNVRLDFNVTTSSLDVVLPSLFVYVPRNTSGSTEFAFETYCLVSTSNVRFNLTISIHEQANTTVTIPFQRDCTPPLVHIGLLSTDDRGIYNGTTVLWTPPTDNPTMLTRSFFVSVSPFGANGNFPFSFDIDSSDEFIGSPVATPAQPILAPGLEAGKNITVTYMCINNGRIDLNMTIRYGWKNAPIVLKWAKTCNPNYLGANATFWNVGTSSGASDIIAGGVAQGAWALVNSSFPYNSPQQQYTVWFSYNPGTVSLSWVTCQNKVNDLYAQGENGYTIAPAAFATLVPPTTPSSLTFISVCRVPNAKMITEFEFECAVNGTSINPLKFFFQWTCTPPTISLGSSSGATDAINSNVPSTLFQPAITFPTDRNIVFLYLSVPYSPLYVNATIAPVVPGVQITPNEPTDTQQLLLAIDCATVGRALNSTLYVYYGFVTPFIVPMELQCGSSAPINAESSGGISGAGVAAIVIVVLVFVACVAGCVYNLNVAGKRGWEIVPGYTQFESCKDRVMGPQRYTPQMEDYDQSALTGGYGSTSTGSRYQNDL